MAYIDHTKGDTPNLPELPGRAMKIIEEFEENHQKYDLQGANTWQMTQTKLLKNKKF